MIKKPNKLIQYVSIALGAVLACGVFMSSTNFSLSNIVRSRASETISGSIVFNKETGTVNKIDDTTMSVSGKTSTGYTVYMVSHNIEDISSSVSYIAKFGYSLSVESSKQYVVFSSDENGSSPERFQNISGIKIETTTNVSVNAYYSSTDGINFDDTKYQSVSCSSSPSKVTFENVTHYLKLGVTSFMTRNIVSIELFYENCNPHYDPSIKTLTSISLSGQTTTYTVGDSFSFDGTCTAYYDDDTNRVVTPTSVSSPDMSSTGSKTVTVSYTEGDVTKTAEYTITVNSAEAGLSGIYKCNDNANYYFDFDKMIYGRSDYGSKVYFTLDESDPNAVTFTQKVGSDDPSYFSYLYRLFLNSTTGEVNSTGIIASSTTITVQVGTSRTRRTFTKQS